MKNSIFLLVFLSLASSIDIKSQVLEQWVRRYNGPANNIDAALSIAVDGLGNVYVTGYSRNSPISGTYDYATIKYNPLGFQLWVQTYNGPGNDDDYGYSLAVDGSGNVYVTGYSTGSGTNYDYATIKYNTFGVQQWVQRYNGPGNDYDYAISLAIDASGNVYVTGSSWGGSGTGSDYATIKYNSSGVQQWVARFNGPGNGGDGAYSIAVDASGNAYVTGSSYEGITYSFAYATIKYNSLGIQQWVAIYNGTESSYSNASKVAVDVLGNVYVTGSSRGVGSQYDYATLKYNSSGVQQWVQRYNGPANDDDHAFALAVDASGNVYVAGASQFSGSNYDYATIKYNSTGSQQWVQQYNGPGNSLDYVQSLVTDASSNVYVTGISVGSGTDSDYATIKYNSSGVQQWVARYNGPGNDADFAYSIAIDGTGNVYVTGKSEGNGTNYDYATIKYIQALSASSNLTAGAVSSSRINLNWTDNSDNELGFKIERTTNIGVNWILRDSVARNITTYADTGLMANTTYHYRIYAYNANGNSAYSNIASATTYPTGLINNGQIPDKFALYDNYPNPFNPNTKIRFDIPSSSKPGTINTELLIYDILGHKGATLINEQLKPGSYEVDWDASNYPSGIYFYKLTVGDPSTGSGHSFADTKKMVLVK